MVIPKYFEFGLPIAMVAGPVDEDPLKHQGKSGS